jgi:hypothetical protein
MNRNQVPHDPPFDAPHSELTLAHIIFLPLWRHYSIVVLAVSVNSPAHSEDQFGDYHLPEVRDTIAVSQRTEGMSMRTRSFQTFGREVFLRIPAHSTLRLSGPTE